MSFIDIEVTESNLLNAINGLTESEKITLWNDYQNGYNSSNHIFMCDMDVLSSMFLESEDVIFNLCNGKVNYKDKYIYCNSYGIWESFNSVDYVMDSSDIIDIIDWIINCDGQTNVIDLNDLIIYEE